MRFLFRNISQHLTFGLHFFRKECSFKKRNILREKKYFFRHRNADISADDEIIVDLRKERGMLP